jgi:hypothetical protein
VAGDEPTIRVIKDYDGWFEGFVRSLIKQKKEREEKFNHSVVEIEAIPFYPHACSFEKKEGGVLYLAFYSALRAGFGSLSQEDKENLTHLL